MPDRTRCSRPNLEQVRSTVDTIRARCDERVDVNKALARANNRALRIADPMAPELTIEQTETLCDIGLDRDRYKLHYYLSQTVEGVQHYRFDYFLAHTIWNTKKVWSKFDGAFPEKDPVSNLYEPYATDGEALKQRLDDIMKNDSVSLLHLSDAT